MTDELAELLSNFELPPSEELKCLDKAIEESKKIQSLLEASSIQIEKLSSRNEAASNNYFYNLTPSKRLTHSCVKAEYEIFSLYNTHLSYILRQKLEICSPQRHRRVRKISYASLSSSSSPSASSNEHINQIEDPNFDDEDKCLTGVSRPMFGCRTRKDFLKTYNRTKTERIKCKREMEAALISLEKSLSLSSERAREAKNYNWFREGPRRKRGDLSASLLCHARRSISSSMCRIKTSTPIHSKRPMSSSVIF
jgi:hypothetical protein